jgi:hypothetical protein
MIVQDRVKAMWFIGMAGRIFSEGIIDVKLPDPFRKGILQLLAGQLE